MTHDEQTTQLFNELTTISDRFPDISTAEFEDMERMLLDMKEQR